MPGVAPLSGLRRKMSFPPGPAASTMPSETPKRIFRGARFASSTTKPLKGLGLVGGANAREHLALAEGADVEGQT